MFVLINDFHGTATCVRNQKLCEKTVRSIWKCLCGIENCECGAKCGTRGGKWGIVESTMDPNKFWLEKQGDRNE